MILLASSTLCIRKRATLSRKGRKNQLKARYLRKEWSDMRPLTTTTGMRRTKHPKKKLGQNSVSAVTNSSGLYSYKIGDIVTLDEEGNYIYIILSHCL